MQREYGFKENGNRKLAREKDKIIEGEFKALVPDSNQFRPILEKIYRRKIKRSKKKGMMMVVMTKEVTMKVARRKVAAMTKVVMMTMKTRMIHAQLVVIKHCMTEY